MRSKQKQNLEAFVRIAAFMDANPLPGPLTYAGARDALRSRGQRYDVNIDEIETLTDNSVDSTENLIREDETFAIAEAIKKLPEEQAELIRLSFFDGKSHSEIAAEKNLPLGTVKSRMRLALERLRKEQNVRDLW